MKERGRNRFRMTEYSKIAEVDRTKNEETFLEVMQSLVGYSLLEALSLTMASRNRS